MITSVLAGVIGTAVHFPLALFLPFGLLGFASGVAMLLCAVALVRRPSLRIAWGVAILWFACTTLIAALFWLVVSLSLRSGLGLYFGIGGVSASILGLCGGGLAIARQRSDLVPGTQS
jgi:hypothetical protein